MMWDNLIRFERFVVLLSLVTHHCEVFFLFFKYNSMRDHLLIVLGGFYRWVSLYGMFIDFTDVYLLITFWNLNPPGSQVLYMT